MLATLTPLAAAVLLAAAGPTAETTYKDRSFDPGGLDAATLRTLAQKGTLVILDDDGKGHPELTTAGIIIDARPETVYEVITDYASFPEFMPQVQRCEVVKEREDGTRDVEFELKFKFSVISQKVKYTARFHTYEKDKKVGFEFVKGDLEGGGSYVLVPYEDGKKTMLFYSSVSKMDDMGFLMKKLLKEQPHMEAAIHASTASVVSQAVKTRAEAAEEKKAKVSGVRP